MSPAAQATPFKVALTPEERRIFVLDSLLDAKTYGDLRHERQVRADLAARFEMTETQISSFGAYFVIKGNAVLKQFSSKLTLQELFELAILYRNRKEIDPPHQAIAKEFVEAVYKTKVKGSDTQSNAIFSNAVLPTVLSEFCFTQEDLNFLESKIPTQNRPKTKVYNLAGNGSHQELFALGFTDIIDGDEDLLAKISDEQQAKLIVIDAICSSSACVEKFKALANLNNTHFIAHLHAPELRILANLHSDPSKTNFMLCSEILSNECDHNFAKAADKIFKMARQSSVKSSEIASAIADISKGFERHVGSPTSDDMEHGMQIHVPAYFRSVISSSNATPNLDWFEIEPEWVIPSIQTIKNKFGLSSSDDFVERRCQIGAPSEPTRWLDLTSAQKLAFCNFMGVLIDVVFSSCIRDKIKTGEFSPENVVSLGLSEWLDSLTYRRPAIDDFTYDRSANAGDALIHFNTRGTINQINYSTQLDSSAFKLCKFYAIAVLEYISGVTEALPFVAKADRKLQRLTFSDKYNEVVAFLQSASNQTLSVPMGEVLSSVLNLNARTLRGCKDATLIGHASRALKRKNAGSKHA